MYTVLRRGDKLPTVGVLQVLLNRGIAGTKLVKDGIYGLKTKKAVEDFQRPRGLSPDGAVGEKTWPRVSAGTGFRILDAVDITDPDVLSTEGGDIRRAGGNPALIGYMCNGLGQLLPDLAGRMSRAGGVVLLRFYGHGSPAAMGISDGTGSVRIGGRRIYLDDSDMSSLTPGTVAASTGELRMLAPLFGPYSSVELHGCRVARGPSGRQMIQQLANVWGVPVSAAIEYQYAGGASTFRFEGRVHTAFPGGISLRQWADSLPDMPEVSVP
jgi:peptidoglycan hydrolase-like protein with peptidoglycan-binding domain